MPRYGQSRSAATGSTPGRKGRAGKISCILDGQLFVGNQLVSADRDCLQTLNVTAILAIGCKRQHPDSVFAFCKLGLLDKSTADLGRHLDAATSWIHGHVEAGGAVLVHCKAGMSRSPAVAAAYLVRHARMSVDEALAHVKRRRPNVRVRAEFVSQLRQWALRGGAQPPQSPRPTTTTVGAGQAQCCDAAPELLLRHARRGDVATVASVCRHRTMIPQYAQAAMRVAARHGHTSVVRYLCEHLPAGTMCPAAHRSGALRDAASQGHLPVVRYLCEELPPSRGGRLECGSTGTGLGVWPPDATARSCYHDICGHGAGAGAGAARHGGVDRPSWCAIDDACRNQRVKVLRYMCTVSDTALRHLMSGCHRVEGAAAEVVTSIVLERQHSANRHPLLALVGMCRNQRAVHVGVGADTLDAITCQRG